MDNWRIKRLEIKGLLYQYNLKWELSPQVNILGGPNGSGKSTFLHALALVLDGSPAIGQNHKKVPLHSEALFDSLVVEMGCGVECEGKRTVVSREKTGDVKSSFDSDDIVKIHERVVIDCKSRFNDECAKSFEAPQTVYINTVDLALKSIAGLEEGAFNDSRPAKTILDLMIQDALNKRNQLAADYFFNANSSGQCEDSDDPIKIFNRFEESLKVFMPDYRLTNVSVLTFERNGRHIPFFRLSSGEKQLIYILLTVSNCMNKPTILLMDEGETGMHQDWKRILIKELLKLNPNMQIIATTQNSGIINGWRSNVREISQLYI